MSVKVGGAHTVRRTRRESGDNDIEFVALTWNACGMETFAKNDVVDLLNYGSYRWDILLIQEGTSREEGSCAIINGGHAFYVGKHGAAKNTTCILLNRRWTASEASLHLVCERISYLDLKAGDIKLRITTAHMPHADIDLDMFESSLAALADIVTCARRAKRMNVVGIDANAVIGYQAPTELRHGISQCPWTGLRSLVAWFLSRGHLDNDIKSMGRKLDPPALEHGSSKKNRLRSSGRKTHGYDN